MVHSWPQKWTRMTVLSFVSTPFCLIWVMWRWTSERLPFVCTPFSSLVVWEQPLVFLLFVLGCSFSALASFCFLYFSWWGCPPVEVVSQPPLCLMDSTDSWYGSWSIALALAESQTSLLCHWCWSGFLWLQHQSVLLRCWGMLTQGWGAISSWFSCPTPWNHLGWSHLRFSPEYPRQSLPDSGPLSLLVGASLAWALNV